MSKIASDLVEWYWLYGNKRSGPFRILSSWIIASHRCRAIELSLESTSGRYGVAVWGPSQTGKSAFLSTFIDDKEEAKSALMWDETPFVFSAMRKVERDIGSAFGWALNPHSGGNDASACVTRFYGADNVPYSAFPVEMHFAGRRQMLHSIAAGYVSECDLRLAGDPQRIWEVDNLRASLPKDATKGPVDREAAELLMDAIYVVDRLLAEQSIRYLKLNVPSATADETEWENRLKDEILGNPALLSDRGKALDFVATLLWDRKSALTTFFLGIEQARRRFEGIFSDKKIYCSLQAANLFLDMETYRCLQNIDSPSREKVEYVEGKIASMRFFERDGAILVGSQVSGEKLFDTTCTFAHAQSLLWEVSVPLNNEFLEKSAPHVKSFLALADLLDIPGVSNRPQAEKNSLIDVSGPVLDADLFLKVLKRGKTASIINLFSEEGAIDQLLLLLRADRQASQPNQLVTGIKTIWRELDPAYEAASLKPPPAPLTLALTFFNKIIDLAADAAGAGGDPSAIEARLSVLGNVIDPAVCRTFVTSYPQFSEGRSTQTPEALDLVLRDFERSDWITKRFPTQIERESIANTVRESGIAGDGGMSFLLKYIASTVDREAQGRHVLARRKRVDAEIQRLATSVAPIRDQAVDHAKKLIKGLVSDISSEIAKLPASRDGKRRLIEISNSLRKSFSFLPEELQALPSATEDVVAYIDTQISIWIEHSEREAELGALGVPKQDRVAVLEAVSRIINRAAVADVLAGIVAGIGRPDQEYLIHATGFVAASLNSELRGGAAYFGKQPSNITHDDFVNYCNESFPRWMNPNGMAIDNPHYQLVVKPVLERLAEIGETIGEVGRPKNLVGDPEIAAILEAFESRRGAAETAASETTAG
jgi:hypothetical protein